ncbi:MAG: AAA family ATPase [bacterium]
MLERIRIENFKSLRSVDVAMAPLVVVLGPNAAGKSNFLEALQLLSKLGSVRTLDDAFAELRGYPAEAFALPPGGLPGLLERPSASLTLEADVDPPIVDKSGSDRLRYRVSIDINPRAGALSVADEYLTRLNRDGERKDYARIERMTEVDGRPTESRSGRLAVRQRNQPGHPRYEDVGLHYTLISDLHYSGHSKYPEFDRIRAELGSWRTYYLDPRDAMRAAQPPRLVTDIGSRGELLAPFLHRLKSERPSEFQAVLRGLRSAIPGIDGLDVDLDPQRGTLDIAIRQGGEIFSSRVISEGTLRVLALCSIAANPWRSRLVAFEEPENGVHPHRIDTIANLVVNMTRTRRHQVVVTTHSPKFAATIASFRRQPELADRIALLRTRQTDGHTEINRLPDLPLFDETQIEEALQDPDDIRRFEMMYSRGWLDG